MNLVQTVAPTSEPITLAEAKLFMKIIEDDEDTLIESMIVSAREYVENYTNRQIMTATFELTNEIIFSGMALPKSPLTSVSKIEYMDENGAYQTMSSSDYYVYAEYGIHKLSVTTMPAYKCDKRAFKITFTAGYATVPDTIKSYMKILVSTLYENREHYTVGVRVDTNSNPMIDKMLDMFRVKPI